MKNFEKKKKKFKGRRKEKEEKEEGGPKKIETHGKICCSLSSSNEVKGKSGRKEKKTNQLQKQKPKSKNPRARVLYHPEEIKILLKFQGRSSSDVFREASKEILGCHLIPANVKDVYRKSSKSIVQRISKKIVRLFPFFSSFSSFDLFIG